MSTTPGRGERRQGPRVDLLSEFQGHLIALDEVVKVLQLGSGGITIASAVPVLPAHVLDLQLTIDERVITLKGRVVHQRTTIDRDTFTYVAGLAFVDLAPEAAQAIEAFLARNDSAGGDDSSEGAAR